MKLVGRASILWAFSWTLLTPGRHHHCEALQLAQLPPCNAATAAAVRPSSPTANNFAAFPSLNIAYDNLPGLPEYRSQDQQVNAALPLGGSIRGQWRIREERGPAMSVDGTTSRTCVSTVIFRGFVDDPGKGILEYDSGSCGETSSGRWVAKTTRVVQITARWKVKLPAGKFIYVGFIDAGRTVGRSGSVSAEMTGLIQTGEEIRGNKVVGKFKADLIRRFDSEEKIGGESGGLIELSAPKTDAPPII